MRPKLGKPIGSFDRNGHDNPRSRAAAALRYAAVRVRFEDDDEPARAPYEISADGLDRAVLEAQIERLNSLDRRLVRARLKLAPPPDVAPIDPNATEKAFAKLRHPSVAKVYRLRLVTPADSPQDPAADPSPADD